MEESSIRRILERMDAKLESSVVGLHSSITQLGAEIREDLRSFQAASEARMICIERDHSRYVDERTRLLKVEIDSISSMLH